MTDYRFPSPGVDARFPSPGTDIEYPSPGTDARFPSPGTDTRFDGGYAGVATYYSREYTENSGDETIDLSTIGPAESGVATYILSGTPTGVSLLGSILTIDTDTASGGNITVTRDDDNPDRSLILTLSLSPATIDIVSGAGEIEWAPDTRPDAQIDVSFTSGIYAPQSFTTTPAEVDAIVNGQGLMKLAPIISLSTDTGAANELDPDDVATVDVVGLWIYKSGNTAPTITSTGWHDQAGLLQAGSGDYTGENPSTETTSIFFRESDGTNNGDSSTINVASATPFNSTDLFASAEDGLLIELANSGVWTDTVGGTAATTNDTIAWVSDLSGNANHIDTNGVPLFLDASGVKYTNLSNVTDESLERNGTAGLVSNGPRTHLALLRREPTTGDTFYLSEGISGVQGELIFFRADDDGALVWAPDDVSDRQTFAGSVTGLDVKTGPRVIGYRSKSGVSTIDNSDDFQLYADGTWLDLSALAVTFNIPDTDYRCGRVRGTYSTNTDVAAWILIDRHLTDAEVTSLSNYWKGLV